MEYRKIGNTDMSASVVGLGTEYLDTKPYQTVERVIHKAMELDINIMDVFMPGEEVRRNIGKALKGKRNEVLIQGHICSTDINQQYDISRDLKTVKKFFENLLRFLQTDYIDLGMLFYIDSEQDYAAVFEGDILPYAQNLKKQGVIRALGASSHNPLIARRIVETGEIELLMFSLNPAFDMMPPMGVDDMLGEDVFSGAAGIEPARAALYQACERRNVSITVMKSLGAGKLLSAEFTPFSAPMTVGQCIHYALERPGVASVLLGCQTVEQVKEAVGYMDLSPEERNYSQIISGTRGNFRGSCMYCNHCLPCPAEIDIAAVNKYLDIALLDEKNVPPSIRQHYKALSAHASGCTSCGSCEARCPFEVPVIDRMQKSVEVFGQ